MQGHSLVGTTPATAPAGRRLAGPLVRSGQVLSCLLVSPLSVVMGSPRGDARIQGLPLSDALNTCSERSHKSAICAPCRCSRLRPSTGPCVQHQIPAAASTPFCMLAAAIIGLDGPLHMSRCSFRAHAVNNPPPPACNRCLYLALAGAARQAPPTASSMAVLRSCFDNGW
jgi:hypothetical protein